MINKMDSVSFGNVKYTKAGIKYFNNLPEKSKKALMDAEYSMRKYKRANLVVNQNGYSVQAKDETGIYHSYQVHNVQYSPDYDAIYYTKKADGTQKIFSFNLEKKNKEHRDSTIAATDDATYNTNYLYSSICLVNLLEKNYKNLTQKSNKLK